LFFGYRESIVKPANTAFLVFFAVLFTLGTVMAQETPEPLDKKVRAAYEKIDSAREAMNGELTDEQRVEKMSAFQDSCRKFVEAYEGQASQLDGGLFDLGRAAIQSFSPEKAITFLQGFLAKNKGSKESAEATMFLGDAYRAVNKNKEATKLYQAFIKANPKSDFIPSARLGLATSNFLSLDFEAAIVQYRAIIAKHPKHEVRGDAAFQLLNALVYAGKHDEARAHLAKLIEEAPEAPELAQKSKQLEILGRPAPELTGVVGWQGTPGSSIARMRGRVLVLCFFMMKNIPCARTLQSLSKLERELRMEGVTVWGLTKTYKAGKGDWTVERESKWMGRFRENPRFVLQKELRYTTKGGTEEEEVWGPLEKPITVTLGLTKDTANLLAYRIRRVPTIIVIGKDGRVRLMEEGGQSSGGFQSQMLRQLIRRAAAE
jgi:TolA-binding protein